MICIAWYIALQRFGSVESCNYISVGGGLFLIEPVLWEEGDLYTHQERERERELRKLLDLAPSWIAVFCGCFFLFLLFFSATRNQTGYRGFWINTLFRYTRLNSKLCLERLFVRDTKIWLVVSDRTRDLSTWMFESRTVPRLVGFGQKRKRDCTFSSEWFLFFLKICMKG